MALFDSGNGIEYPIIDLLVRGAVFGTFVAVFRGGSHVIFSRRQGSQKPLDAVQVAAVTIPESGLQALEIVRRSLARIAAHETLTWGDYHPDLLARVRMSWTSWGEEMRFACHPNLDGSTEIHISSRPLWRTLVALDMGKGLKNVKRIVRAIQEGEVRPSNRALQNDRPSVEH